MELVFAALSLVAGMLLAVQAGANAQLAKAAGSPLTATAIQLWLGALVLALAAAASGEIGALARLGEGPAWHALGGIASALYVVATIMLYPRIGAVLAVGLIITGQMAASLGLDITGAFGVAQRAPGPGMIVGSLAILAGAVALVRGGRNGAAATGSLVWIVFGLVAGAVLPLQGAINGLLRVDIGAPLAVAQVSFVVAAVAMSLVVLGIRIWSGKVGNTGSGFAIMPWWGWLGALCGATYVTTVFTAIPVIGTSLTVGLTVLGQQAAALLVDRFGLLRLPQRPIASTRLAGVALLMAGVFAIRFG